MTIFLVTLLLTANGVSLESRELIGFGDQARVECAAKKRQHEFTRRPPANALGIAFYCDVIPAEEARV